MTWFRIDDGLSDHPKWLATPPAARGLWVTAGAWCSKHLTDGLVPTHVLPMLGGKPKDARDLIAAGLWVKVPDGWQIHDFLDRNPSREKVEAERAAARKRVADARAKKAGSSADVRANTERTSDGVTATPTRPDPKVTPQPPAERGAKEAHAGQHANCRACGTTRRALAPVYSHPHVPYPIPDADEWIAEQRDIPVSRPPEGWREQMRSAEV
jgi:hypothetical protein